MLLLKLILAVVQCTHTDHIGCDVQSNIEAENKGAVEQATGA